MLVFGHAGVVAGDRVVGEPAQQIAIAEPGGVLERADAQVARRNSGEHGPRQHSFAGDVLTGGDHRQRTRRGDSEGVHRLADQHLAQHRPDRRLAVATAGEGRAPGTLEVQVASPATRVDDLTQQQRPTIAEPRRVAAELVSGVGHRDRGRSGRCDVAGEDRNAVRRPQRLGVEPELGGQRMVEEQQPRLRARSPPATRRTARATRGRTSCRTGRSRRWRCPSRSRLRGESPTPRMPTRSWCSASRSTCCGSSSAPPW